MKAIFVIGTDTGAGKTMVTGLLGRYLLGKGYNVVTQKWIQTGGFGPSQDIYLHLRLMKRKKEALTHYLSYMVPYIFKFAASPHLAARLEKKKIYAHKIKESFRLLSKKFDFVLVEGIGGALVPFDRRTFVIDIAKELGLAVLIVAQNKLGVINHTLLTIEAVRKRRMRIIGIIFNGGSKKENRIILSDNPKIIKIFTDEEILGDLPWLKNEELLYKTFIPIGNKILAQLKRK